MFSLMSRWDKQKYKNAANVFKQIAPSDCKISKLLQ